MNSDFDYNKNIHFLNEYCDFSNPNHVWILKGISRTKDNTNNPEMDKFFRRMIITCPEDIVTSYREIHLLANDPLTTYRIYVSLNSRDTIKATTQFQKTLIDIVAGVANGNPEFMKKIKLLNSIWKNELEQSACRGTKRVLLDIDDSIDIPIEIVDFITDICKTKIYCVRQTVTGWAIVFDACDTRSLMIKCEELGIKADLHRDSMLFIESFQPFC